MVSRSASTCLAALAVALLGAACVDQHVQVLTTPASGVDGGGCLDVDVDLGQADTRVALAVGTSGPTAVGLVGEALVSYRLEGGAVVVHPLAERVTLSLVSAVATSAGLLAVGYSGADGGPTLRLVDGDGRPAGDALSVLAHNQGSGAPWGLRVSAQRDRVTFVYRTLAATAAFTNVWADGGSQYVVDPQATGEVDGVATEAGVTLVTQSPNLTPTLLETQAYDLAGVATSARQPLATGPLVGRPFVCPQSVSFARASDAGVTLEQVSLAQPASPRAIGLVKSVAPRLVVTDCARGFAAFYAESGRLRVADLDSGATVFEVDGSVGTDFALASDDQSAWVVVQSPTSHTSHLLRRCLPR